MSIKNMYISSHKTDAVVCRLPKVTKPMKSSEWPFKKWENVRLVSNCVSMNLLKRLGRRSTRSLECVTFESNDNEVLQLSLRSRHSVVLIQFFLTALPFLYYSSSIVVVVASESQEKTL